ncbi:CLUMA_CG021524, isoform A [Clunio marinus]|uniref:CLUMA_CG021524, isoform A n=1 Tax=Clunio marinus TaxID=568069 RepID=A0A1J1J7X4_9DIPT|nr:CLUMA_CG021524, isoform A [Clunio marinus]
MLNLTRQFLVHLTAKAFKTYNYEPVNAEKRILQLRVQRQNVVMINRFHICCYSSIVLVCQPTLNVIAIT